MSLSKPYLASLVPPEAVASFCWSNCYYWWGVWHAVTRWRNKDRPWAKWTPLGCTDWRAVIGRRGGHWRGLTANGRCSCRKREVWWEYNNRISLAFILSSALLIHGKQLYSTGPFTGEYRIAVPQITFMYPHIDCPHGQNGFFHLAIPYRLHTDSTCMFLRGVCPEWTAMLIVLYIQQATLQLHSSSPPTTSKQVAQWDFLLWCSCVPLTSPPPPGNRVTVWSPVLLYTHLSSLFWKLCMSRSCSPSHIRTHIPTHVLPTSCLPPQHLPFCLYQLFSACHNFFISVDSLPSLTCVHSSSALLHSPSTLPVLLIVQHTVSEQHSIVGHGSLNRTLFSATVQTARDICVCTHQQADTE